MRPPLPRILRQPNGRDTAKRDHLKSTRNGHRVVRKPTVLQEASAFEGQVTEEGQVGNGEAYAIVKGPEFRNGNIEVELRVAPATAPQAG